MVWLIITVIIALVVVDKRMSNWGDWAKAVLLGILVLFVCIPCSLLIGFVLGNIMPNEYIQTETIEIVAFGNKSGIEGSFFLGSGHINDKPVYQYLQSEAGGVRLNRIDANQAIVYEDDYVPRIEVYERKLMKKWHTWFGLVSGMEYRVYIPEGSITYEYNIDVTQ